MPQSTLTQSQIDALKTTLRARWNAGLAAAPNDWQRIAKKISSGSKSNTYAWLSQFPAFREWVGARNHKVMKEHAYMVVNRKFETTVDVPREDIEDDNIGQYGTLAESAGHANIDLMNDLVFQALAGGWANTCYDGQYFFDTDHPVYPNEDGSGTAATVSNLQAGTGAAWALLCTKRAASPLYLQERVAPEFTAKTSAANSDGVFENDTYSFGARWRGEAAYGFWQCAYGSRAALNDDNFNAAVAAMMKFVGDGNRKLGIVPDLLVVGPDLRAAAKSLLEAQVKANGASNTNYHAVDLLVTPWFDIPAIPESGN
ncbi:MAG: Mu-like prophage major head subunit gpT family protein [Zoogloeaceae bacterium]|jgi:phage major head subunit gpT-like protein|nr:Mu-like prophage major head subunit gpT family protein [Zoogloeaceae bacterium]